MSQPESFAELLERAATQLRAGLDPEATPYDDYERLMLDLNWPVALSRWLDAAADVERDIADSETNLLDEIEYDATRQHGIEVARAILRAVDHA